MNFEGQNQGFDHRIADQGCSTTFSGIASAYQTHKGCVLPRAWGSLLKSTSGLGPHQVPVLPAMRERLYVSTCSPRLRYMHVHTLLLQAGLQHGRLRFCSDPESQIHRRCMDKMEACVSCWLCVGVMPASPSRAIHQRQCHVKSHADGCMKSTLLRMASKPTASFSTLRNGKGHYD